MLQHLPHRAQLKVALGLQALDEVDHLLIVVLTYPQLVTYITPRLILEEHLLLQLSDFLRHLLQLERADLTALLEVVFKFAQAGCILVAQPGGQFLVALLLVFHLVQLGYQILYHAILFVKSLVEVEQEGLALAAGEEIVLPGSGGLARDRRRIVRGVVRLWTYRSLP